MQWFSNSSLVKQMYVLDGYRTKNNGKINNPSKHLGYYSFELLHLNVPLFIYLNSQHMVSPLYLWSILNAFNILHDGILTKGFCCVLISGTLLNVSLKDHYRRPSLQGFWNGVDWILENGSPLVYTNWDIDQPKKLDTKHYIRLVDGKWRTTIPTIIRPIFCSYNP